MKRLLFTSMLLLAFSLTFSQKMYILGSSTAYGTGASPGNSWAEIFGAYAINNGKVQQVINLAIPSVTHKVAMPDWYGGADTTRNIDKAIRGGATYIVVSYVSNGYNTMNINEVLSDFRIMARHADSAGARIIITSTQPRSSFSPTEQLKLKQLADSINAQNLYKSVDFFYPLAQAPEYGIKAIYAMPDSVHINDLGHDTLAKQMIYANVFAPMIFTGPDINTTSANVSSTYSVSNMAVGKYKAVLLLYDSTGNLLSVDSTSITRNAIVIKPPPPIDTTIITPPPAFKSVKVNLFGGMNPYTVGNWNNWNVTGSSNITSSNFIYDDGTLSPVNAVLSYSQGVIDNGVAYGGIMCPAPVLRHATYSTSTRTLTIKGLTGGQGYNLEFYASRNNSGNKTVFSIGGILDTVTTNVNLTEKAIYTNVMPVNGQIVVTMSRIGTYTYLNGFIISAVQPQSNQETITAYERGQVFHENIIVPNLVNGNIELLDIIDMWGRLVKRIQNPVGKQVLDDLKPGVYVIRTKEKNSGKVTMYQQKYLKL